MIEIATADGQRLSVYRADPPEAAKGAVVVVPDILGIDAHVRTLADELATRGYVAIAPVLPERTFADASPTEAKHGQDPVAQPGTGDPFASLQAAVDAVRDVGRIAILGQGRGGLLAYRAASRISGLSCAIGYYATGIEDDFRAKCKVPTLLHFGESDASLPLEQVVQFRAHRPDVSVYTYPAGQGFDREDGEGFHAPSAALALERTLFWISQFVEGQSPIQLKNAGAYAQAKTDRKKKVAAAADDGPPP
jgi:carboxymethylenebutenolidase